MAARRRRAARCADFAGSTLRNCPKTGSVVAQEYISLAHRGETGLSFPFRRFVRPSVGVYQESSDSFSTHSGE